MKYVQNTALVLGFAGLLFASCIKDDIFGDEETDTTVIDDSAGSDFETDAEDDDVTGTTFIGTVTVEYAAGGASVTMGNGLTGSDFNIVTSKNDVTVTYNGEANVIYKLTGSASDGFFKLYSSHKQQLLLSGLSLTNPDGAAVNVQSGKRTFVVLDGKNTLADGPGYADETSSEDMKAAFFSEGQLIFSGSGSLTVTATGKAAITSDDYVRFMDGRLSVKATSTAGHGIRGKDGVILSDGKLEVETSGAGKKGITSDGVVYIAGGEAVVKNTGSAGEVDGELTGCAGIKADQRFEMTGGVLEVTATGTGGKGISGDNVGFFTGGTVTVNVSGANYGNSGGGWGGGGGGRPRSDSDNSVSSKGIKFDGNLHFDGADVRVTCASHEGIEAKGTLTVTGGSVYSHASDDAINSGGDMTVSGGHVYAHSTGNDGMDANGDLYIEDGVVYAIGSSEPEVAVDANTEGGYMLYLKGGVVVAIGGLERGSSLSQGVVSTNISTGTAYALMLGDDVLAAFSTPSELSTKSVTISSPELSNGTSCSLYSGVTLSGGTAWWDGLYVDDATVSGGSSTSLTATTSSGGGGFPGR